MPNDVSLSYYPTLNYLTLLATRKDRFFWSGRYPRPRSFDTFEPLVYNTYTI